MTVRQMVKEMQIEIRDRELLPDRAAVLLTKLTALVGNTNDEIRLADAEYASHLLVCLQADEAVNRARVRAETSAEYQRKREARDTRELVKEMIGGLKYLLRNEAEAMRLTR